MKAKHLLERGLVWRVGNGEQTTIWGDRWLPNAPSNQVHSLVRQLNMGSKVSALIDHSTGKWDCPIIQSSFVKYEDDMICSLLLVRSLNQTG